MSDTIHLACVTCKTYLWVGQGGYRAPAKAYLYGTDEAKEKFTEFYDVHMAHDVRLVGMDAMHKLAHEWTEFGDDDEEDWRSEAIHLGI